MHKGVEILLVMGTAQPEAWEHLLALDLGQLRYLCKTYEGACKDGASEDELRRQLARFFKIEIPTTRSAMRDARSKAAKLKDKGGYQGVKCLC